jgi:hypothetical protein
MGNPENYLVRISDLKMYKPVNRGMVRCVKGTMMKPLSDVDEFIDKAWIV